ncbi:MAG: PEGA domain-containing protein, partial [Telluria sp.]
GVALGVALLVIAGFGARWLLSTPSDIIMPAAQADAPPPVLPDAAPAPAVAVAATDEPGVDDILAQAASATVVSPMPAPAATPAAAVPAVAQPASDAQVSVDAILATAPVLEEKPVVPDTASYRLAIKPWGTVYVDGKEKGVSPPLKRLVLPSGKHKIRIANPGFPDYSMDVNLAKGKSGTIDYDFAARSK